jgi:hypothetical protein
MAKENANVHVYADQGYAVLTAPAGTAVPTTFTLDSNGNVVIPTGFVEVGLLSDAGITEGHNLNETKIFDLSGALLRIARNQEERPFTFEALEDNAEVRRLLYRNAATTTAGATAEVHTITISGTPTGGTWSATLPGYGTASGLAYNAPVSSGAGNVQTALRNAWGLNVAVTGTAGTSYVITYPTAAGNVPASTADGTGLTGGTSPAATSVVTTPGVTGVNTTSVGSGTGRDLRPFCIILKDGSVVKMIVISSGEATQSGTTTYSGSAASVYQFTLQPYKDGNGFFFVILDNDAAQGEVSA